MDIRLIKNCLSAAIAVLVCIAALPGCSSTPEMKTVPIEKKSWKITITGMVKNVNIIDVDKSGRNPRFILRFTVQIETYDDGGWETVLGPEAKIVYREKDLKEQTGRELKAGDRIFITAYITEKSPDLIEAESIKFL